MGSAKRIKADLARWLTLVLIKEITHNQQKTDFLYIERNIGYLRQGTEW